MNLNRLLTQSIESLNGLNQRCFASLEDVKEIIPAYLKLHS